MVPSTLPCFDFAATPPQRDPRTKPRTLPPTAPIGAPMMNPPKPGSSQRQFLSSAAPTRPPTKKPPATPRTAPNAFRPSSPLHAGASGKGRPLPAGGGDYSAVSDSDRDRPEAPKRPFPFVNTDPTAAFQLSSGVGWASEVGVPNNAAGFELKPSWRERVCACNTGRQNRKKTATTVNSAETPPCAAPDDCVLGIVLLLTRECAERSRRGSRSELRIGRACG